ASAMSLPDFSHDPLPDSPRHIRLLEILQGDFGQHVICTLSTWEFDNAPPYVAISYTWGDPKSTTDITVNERCMLVRKNCEYALQQVFHNIKNHRQYVWLDAICIDQSNIRERGHQVAFMGELYKKSSQVFA
ncbi:heterokaryon incompatibility protein-domain-containing protein, partial [Paraphoma chrysanthemicola]